MMEPDKIDNPKTNPFLLGADHYKRDLDIMAGYIEQQAIFLHRCTEGTTIQMCVDFVMDEIFVSNPINDPMFLVLEQNEVGDREQKAYSFSRYLNDVIVNNYLIAPTLTVIYPPEKRESTLARYIKGKLQERSDEKALQFKAQREGDAFRETLHNNNQNTKKILINAISGNHRSVHSILYDKPIHPILTSSCRIANGSANSHDDRFLAGNRHYYTQSVVLDNISSIITLTDMELLDTVIKKYNLYIPSVEDVLNMIWRSASNYWQVRGGKSEKHIVRYVKALTARERVAVMYIGDLYHLDMYNPHHVGRIIDALSVRPTEAVPDHQEWLDAADGDTKTQIRCCFPEVMGDKTLKDDEPKQHPDYPLLGTMAKQIYDTFHYYKDLIRCLWLSKNVPFLISDFPSSIRKVGVGSDTDSAIFTVQDYVRKYTKVGNDNLNQDNIVLAEAVGYLVSMTTIHNLATMTSNMGVTGEEIFRLSMKNEYLFPIFYLTSRAKHYFANMAVQEGSIFKKLRYENKGVELIAGNIPDETRADLEWMRKDMIDTITNGDKINLSKYLKLVASWEYRIHDSIVRGETQYLKAARVNDEEAYSDSIKNSAYINYLMWEECFADKYGSTEAPPYSALSFSLIHDTKTKTKNWLASWEDQTRATRFGDWLASRDKDYMGILLLPESIVLSSGVPSEILDAIDVRKIIYKAMSPFYLVLESLEFYLQDSKQTRLVMDLVDREDAFKGTGLV